MGLSHAAQQRTDGLRTVYFIYVAPVVCLLAAEPQISPMANHNIYWLPSSKPVPRVERLGYLDILKAAETYSISNATDPFVRYLRDNRPQTHLQRLAEKASISLYLMAAMRTKTALTVGHGRANLIGTPPKSEELFKDGLTTFLEDLRVILKRQRDKITKESEKQRLLEYEDKMASTVHEFFGDYVDEMWYLEGLSTHPAWRKQGYGGALLDSIAAMADAKSKTCWLQSSNIANTNFYVEHGYVPITTVTVGDSNPDWNAPPVVITIMIRTPNNETV